MAFGYGKENRFYDQIVASAITSAGDYGPVIAGGGDINGGIAITLTAKTAITVSALTLSYKEADTLTGSYTAPSPQTTVTFGGSAYAAGDTVGSLVIPNGAKDFVKATVGGTVTSGTLEAHLQYLPR